MSESSGDTDAGASPDANLRHHVASLDGVRAVAILLVLAFHLHIRGVPFRSAGYLGVDVFFVLSGFLITSLLLDEHRRRDAIALSRFYARRALRILPLVGVLLVIGLIISLTTEPKYSWRPDLIAFVATAGFWSNWLTIWKPASDGVFNHTWSLAIEEQFYLVWPSVLALLLFGRVRLRYVALLLTGAVVTGALLRVHIWSEAPADVSASASDYAKFVVAYSRGRVWQDWYYKSFSHMDGLFVGALAAVAMSTSRVRAWLTSHSRFTTAALLAAVGTSSAVVIAASRSIFPDFLPMWGLVVLEVSIAVVVACLAAGSDTTVLAWRPLVWIGRRSYGIYMLHIPALIFVTRFRLGRVVGSAQSGHATTWITLALTFGAAALSYRFVELPALRLSKKRFSVPTATPTSGGSREATR